MTSRRSSTTKRTASPATWQLQTAKARLSEVIRRARTSGPQIVTRQGKEEVVILAIEAFRSLARRARQPRSLAEFFAKSPLAQAGIDLHRPADYGRTVKL